MKPAKRTQHFIHMNPLFRNPGSAPEPSNLNKYPFLPIKPVFVQKRNVSGRHFLYMFFIHTVISQGHNLYKLQYISLEGVKIVSFQQ